MKKYPNIMPYIHLPIQSGDEFILKQMNRSMKIGDYLKTINYIKTNIPNCAISTDIIVGFPNETDVQFENTVKLYEKVKFDNAYTFIYSPRSGTSAALIKDKTNLATKQERLSRLNEIVRKYAKWNSERWVNKVIPVLVEGLSKTNKNTFTGYSPE
jgi:tRNA-2-methylthio-N6-dimethylallyladenosine synthase